MIRFDFVLFASHGDLLPFSKNKTRRRSLYAPLLMLAKPENDNLPTHHNDAQVGRSFVIPYGGDGDGDGDGVSNYKMGRSFDLVLLPKAQGRRCWGSPYGWVVTIALDLNIHLLNPLTGAQLPLPPQPILQDQSLYMKQVSIEPPEPVEIISVYIYKFALVWHQSTQSWLVMAIFGALQEVAFTFTGIQNSSWTCIDSTFSSQDVIFFQGPIFIIDRIGNLSVCDIKEGTPPKAIRSAPPPVEDMEEDMGRCFNYLVEIGGELHMVTRFFESVFWEDHLLLRREFDYETIDFWIWRFDLSKRQWYAADDLGEYALFLGNNTSFAISTTIYPHFSRNFIYFTDEHYCGYDRRFCDMGAFNRDDSTIHPFDIANMGTSSKFSRPIFFMPTL